MHGRGKKLLLVIHAGEPSITERLIVLFELGNRGQNHHRDQTNSDFGGGYRFKRSYSPYSFLYDDIDEVCSSTPVCATRQSKNHLYSIVTAIIFEASFAFTVEPPLTELS